MDKKLLPCLAFCLVEWGKGLSESFKKGKFKTKIFFPIVLSEILKIPSKLEIQCKTMCPLNTMCPHTFEPPTSGLYPPLRLTPSTVAQFISPPGDVSP